MRITFITIGDLRSVLAELNRILSRNLGSELCVDDGIGSDG